MENEIFTKLKENEEKLEKIYVSVEKTRKYFLWVMISSIAFLVLPIIGLLFAIPSFLETYSSISSIGGF